MSDLANFFGTWQEEKAKIDALDDGHGPYMYWCLGDEEQYKILWPEFLKWAKLNLACGISFACIDGMIIVPACDSAFKSYVAGRNYKQTNSENNNG